MNNLKWWYLLFGLNIFLENVIVVFDVPIFLKNKNYVCNCEFFIIISTWGLNSINWIEILLNHHNSIKDELLKFRFSLWILFYIIFCNNSLNFRMVRSGCAVFLLTQFRESNTDYVVAIKFLMTEENYNMCFYFLYMRKYQIIT